ncbi:MAG: uroporphyrinogen-III C-methyltransferase [Myxococcota bacterium]
MSRPPGPRVGAERKAVGRSVGLPVGKVILVGAGPGDPDLITVRGADVLGDADVVVYDALAAPALLELAPEAAERFNVGKRGHDEPTRSQSDINELLVSLARAGKTVVRLKGGDPFVFGRGGEEAMACADAGVPFEVVPGVSSVIGALAYAGIPITDRRHSASFAVVTGHKDPTRVSKETRWPELAGAADTLVILMGMRNLESLIDRVQQGGRAPETPAAAIMNGTLPTQRVVEAPLGELAKAVADAGIGAPTAVVIGEVVGLREKLAWYEKRPLFGRRVLVTRAADQAAEIVRALSNAGAQPVVIPMIETVPAKDRSDVDAALRALRDYDAVLFSSVNAVHFLVERASELGVPLLETAPAVACVGPQTAAAARERGLAVAITPAERFDAAGLVEAVRSAWGGEGKRYLLPQADTARPVLRDGLRAAGARVDAVTAYRTVPPEIDRQSLRDRLMRGELDALTFTSPSTVTHFASLLDEASKRAARACRIAAIGPVTADALRGVGFDPQIVPQRATVRDLVSALAASESERSEVGESL